MQQPSNYNRSSIDRKLSNERNVLLGLRSGGGIKNGWGNVFVGRGAGSSVTSGNNNIIIGSYAGEPSVSDSVVISNAAGKVLAQWDASGQSVASIDSSIGDGSGADPVRPGTMTTKYDAAAGVLRYRIRDASGLM